MTTATRFAYNWRGDYSATTQYVTNDLVKSSGSVWRAIVASYGQTPSSTSTYWELFVSAGSSGASAPLVASIAALQAVTGQSDGDMRSVTAYGVYRYSAASTATANSLHIVTPTSGGGRWILLVPGPALIPTINVRDYGAVGDGSADDTAAFTAAIAAAVASRCLAVTVPLGRYKITDVLTVSGGVRFLGAGGQGAMTNNGTVIDHYTNGHLFNFTGTLSSGSNGVGGGVENMCIRKADGFSGGSALRAIATDNAGQRAGEMVFRNVLVSSANTGLWARGLEIDGTAATSAGNKGVRSVLLEKVRVADCTANNEYIVINQGTHVYGDGVQVDQGSGTGTVGMTIKGDSENVCLSGLVINGNLYVSGNATHVNLQGRISAPIVDNASAIGSFVGSCTSTPDSTAPTFTWRTNRNPSFSAILSASTSNDKTGDGTAYTIVCDTERHDAGANYASGVFTAPVAGRYRFIGRARWANLDASFTTGELSIAKGGTTQDIKTINPGAVRAASNHTSQEIVSELTLAKGDTVDLRTTVYAGTKTVGLVGDATVGHTAFMGGLL